MRQLRITQRMRDLRLVHDRGQLAGAQQWHRAHRDAACLDHAEPARGEHRRIGAAQQHAVAADQSHVLHKHAGDAVGLRQQLGIGPVHAVAEHAHALAPAVFDGAVEQLDGAIQARLETAVRAIRIGTRASPRVAAGCRARRCRCGRCGSWWLGSCCRDFTATAAALVARQGGPYHRAHENVRRLLSGSGRSAACRRSTDRRADVVRRLLGRRA